MFHPLLTDMLATIVAPDFVGRIASLIALDHAITACDVLALIVAHDAVGWITSFIALDHAITACHVLALIVAHDAVGWIAFLAGLIARAVWRIVPSPPTTMK